MPGNSHTRPAERRETDAKNTPSGAKLARRTRRAARNHPRRRTRTLLLTLTLVLPALSAAGTVTAPAAEAASAAVSAGPPGKPPATARRAKARHTKAGPAKVRTVVRVKRHVVTGRLGGKARPVSIQQAIAGSWITVATTRTNKRGDFRLDTRLWASGNARYRLAAPAYAGRPAYLGRALALRPGTSYHPAGSPTDFRLLPIGRFSSCQTPVLGYRINQGPLPASRRAAWLADIHRGAAIVGAASGFRMQYLGSTDWKPGPLGHLLTPGWPADTQVVIDLGNDMRLDGLPFDGRLSTGGRYRLTRASIHLGFQAPVTHNPGSANNLTSVVVHEFGHALGLDHAVGTTQKMHGTATTPGYQLGAGDLAGFARVGARHRCLTDLLPLP